MASSETGQLCTPDAAVAVSPTPPWDRDPSNHPLVTCGVKAVSAKLFERISSGSYSFGTRIPAERQLSQEFGESRNTIRRAIGFLEYYRVVTRRGGSGTFVSIRFAKPADPSPTEQVGLQNAVTDVEGISPFEMHVARSSIEPEIARLATTSLSIRDLANLKDILSNLNVAADPDHFVRLEQSFLMSLCHGTRNTAIIAMYGILNQVRLLPQWCAHKKRSLTPDGTLEVKLALNSLLTALEHRKVDNAVECMRRYIALSQEEMFARG